MLVKRDLRGVAGQGRSLTLTGDFTQQDPTSYSQHWGSKRREGGTWGD